MAEKIGCFVCTGCGIGQSVDTNKLLQIAIEEKQASVARSHTALCQKEGLTLIQSEIKANGLEAIAVGACSGRDHTNTFSFPDIYVDRANLREGVAWTQESGTEDTQMLAEDVIRMSIGRSKFALCPKAQPAQVQNRLLVIGGGVSG